MTKEEKKIHDLKFEIRQLRLRVEENEMTIKKLMDDLEMANEISLKVLNSMVDDVKKLKEEKK